MRSILLFACLCLCYTLMGQGSGFSFSYTGPTQINVGTSCMAPLNWGHPNTPTASSNLPGGVIVSFNIYSISGGYQIGDQVMGGTTVTVFYQALDNFGNTALFGFSIVFIDLIPPVFDPLSLPANITISCVSNLPPPAVVEATDNCADEDPPLTITYTQTNNATLCTGGSVQRRWVADDDLGNTAQYVQTITVRPDTTAPVIVNNLQNGMAPCSTAMAQYTTWLNTQRANFMATDAGCGIMTLSDNAPAPAIITSFCGNIDVTFTAKDNCNNTSTVIRTFTVTNNVSPVIGTPASGASGNCSAPNIAQTFNAWISSHGGATATDDCSSVLWSTFPAMPSLADTCNAGIEVLFIAGDGCNNFDTTAATFTLLDDTPPSITTPPSTMVLACTTPNLDSLLMDWLVTGGHSEAHDLCTPDNQLQLGYNINGNELTLEEVLDAWQDSLVSGCRDGVLINGIGINNVKALLEVRFTYDDNCDNEGGAVGFFGITDNGRPVFDTLPASLAFACAEGLDWMSAFQDWYDSAGNADYSDACSNVTISASITADSAITYLSAALDTACEQGVSVTILFTLQDDCGNMSMTSPAASFSLGDTIAPVIIVPASDLIADCGVDIQMQLENWLDTLGGAQAMDGCGTLLWSFSWIDTAGMTQTGLPDLGPYPPVSALGCNEAIDIIFSATDICQNTVSDTALFMVTDTTAPAIMLPQDTIVLSCTDTIPEIIPVISDLCDASPVITFADSVSMDSCLGKPDFILRTYFATDACGNISSAQLIIMSADTIAPTFDLPADTVSFCSIDTLSLLNVSDNCDPAPVVSFEDVISGEACQQTLTRTWTVTDACGNSTTAEQMFDLSDDAPPTIVMSPGQFVFGCDSTAMNLQDAYEQWMSAVEIQDACSSASYFIAETGSYIPGDTMTYPGTPLPDSIMLMCGDVLSVTGDLFVYDDCGNFASEAISFSVSDTTGPVFLDCQSVISVLPDSSCTGVATLVVPQTTDICFPENIKIVLVLNGGDTIALDSVVSIDTLLSVGIHLAEWIARDCNGNASVCETQIAVIDEDALTIICPADTVIHTTSDDCQTSLYVYAPETITAGCGLGANSWSGYIDTGAEPESFVFNGPADSVLVQFSPGAHQVFLIAMDITGDIDTCKYQVSVIDTFPPEIICQSDTISITISGSDTITTASTDILVSVADACGVDTLIYNPDMIDCTSAGQTIPVEITVIDQGGNSSTCIAMLTIMTDALTPTWSRGLCDDTLRLFSSIMQDSVGSYTFDWSGPNGYMSEDENPVIPNSDTTFNGIYTLVVTGATGCTATGSVEVSIADLVSPVITAAEDSICAGEDIVLQSQMFSGDVVYHWFEVTPDGDTLLASTPDPEFIISEASPGMYMYYAVILSDTCQSAPGAVITVTVFDIPAASIAALPSSICVTDTLFLMVENPDPNLLYSWSGSSGFMSSEPFPPGIPASEIDSAGLFVLIVSNGLCSSLPDSITVSVQSPPATPVIAGDAAACEGGVISLSTVEDADSYDWISPSGNIISTTDDTLTIDPVNMTDAGNWRVITYLQGCISDTSDIFAVTIDTAITIEIITDTAVCDGDSITLSISPDLSGDFIWNGPNGFMSTASTPVTLAATGAYSVEIVSTTGCNASASIDVVVNVAPNIMMLETDADSCVNGENDIAIWVVSDPGFSLDYMYQWDGPQSFIPMDSSIVFQQATSAVNGTYSVVITNGVCATDTAFFTLNVTDSPAPPIITGDNVYCSGDTIELNIDTPIPGASYSWSSSDTSVVVASPGSLVIPDAVLNQSGIYTVFVSIDGCVSSSASIAVQVRGMLPAPVIAGTDFVCEGDSILLSANLPAGAVYTWNGPNGFSSNEAMPFIFPATPLAAGQYTLSYSLNGCDAAAIGMFDVIVQGALPVPGVVTDATALCVDNPVPVTVCLTAASVIEGAQYEWTLNDNTVIGSISSDTCITFSGGLLSGGQNAISVTTYLNGCPSVSSVPVMIVGHEFPSLQADAGTQMLSCPSEEIILNGNDPLPGTGVWSSTDPVVIFENENNPTTSLLPLPSGSYSVVWTLSFETCEDYSVDSVTVTVITVPVSVADTVSIPFGQTGEFIVTLNDLFTMEPYTLEVVMNPQKGNQLHLGNGVFRYTPNLGFVGTDVMIYRVCSRDCPEECSEATVIIRVGDESDCFIPSLFTPNEDGINDVIIIPCLETSQYPNNRILIFNEWGDVVYTASPYLNDWDGTVNGQGLPVGTYFYIMDFGDGRAPKRSFLVLER